VFVLNRSLPDIILFPPIIRVVFHTFFGVAGLSLLGWFDTSVDHSGFVGIHPVYALPLNVTDELGLARVGTQQSMVTEKVVKS
jgi:hypothetical protein